MKTITKDSLKIEGERIYLKILKPDDVGEAYLAWMNNEEVLKFTESRNQMFTRENLQRYAGEKYDSPRDYFFGIFLKNAQRHIGNIKIGGISEVDSSADVGLIIDKDCWGKGFATEAIRLVTRFGFDELSLKRLWAGMMKDNVGSYKAFCNAGYSKFQSYPAKNIIKVECLKKHNEKNTE